MYVVISENSCMSMNIFVCSGVHMYVHVHSMSSMAEKPTPVVLYNTLMSMGFCLILSMYV